MTNLKLPTLGIILCFLITAYYPPIKLPGNSKKSNIILFEQAGNENLPLIKEKTVNHSKQLISACFAQLYALQIKQTTHEEKSHTQNQILMWYSLKDRSPPQTI